MRHFDYLSPITNSSFFIKLFSYLVALIVLTQQSPADPQLTSWFTGDSGQYARIYQAPQRTFQ